MISKMTNQELFQFFEQFSIILRSGMSTVEGLSVLNDDSQSSRGKEILAFLYKDMEESGSLAHAMESSHVFPASAIAYVRTGEETGCLDEVVSGLATFYQQEIQITEQIQSAVTYPLIMLGMMSAVIVILLVKVLPVFRQVFHQLGLEVTGFAGGLLGTWGSHEPVFHCSDRDPAVPYCLYLFPLLPSKRTPHGLPYRIQDAGSKRNSFFSGLQPSVPVYFHGNSKRAFAGTLSGTIRSCNLPVPDKRKACPGQKAAF